MAAPHYGVGIDFERDPRVLKLGADYLVAHAVYIAAGQWSVQHLTNGLIPKEALEVLSPLLDREDVDRGRKALVRVGLFKRAPGGWLDVDFHLHNLLKAQVEDRQAHIKQVRSEAGRKGGLASAAKRRPSKQTSSKPQANEHEAPSNGSKQRSKPQAPLPFPTPTGGGGKGGSGVVRGRAEPSPLSEHTPAPPVPQLTVRERRRATLGLRLRDGTRQQQRYAKEELSEMAKEDAINAATNMEEAP